MSFIQSTVATFALSSLAAGFALAAAPGCADEIRERINCDQICDRYADCFDSSYDTDACFDRCEDNADQSDAFADQAERCEDCLDNLSCSESFTCTTECASIVP